MVLFPSDIVTIINRPLDAKSNVLTTQERNGIPVTQRYKGMIVVVQNVGEEQSKIFWLPTDNLTNTGWVEINLTDLPEQQLEALRNAIMDEVNLRLEEHSCGAWGDGSIIIKLL